MNTDEKQARPVDVEKQAGGVEVLDRVLEPVEEMLPELRGTRDGQASGVHFPSWWWGLVERVFGFEPMEKLESRPRLEQLEWAGELVGRMTAFLKQYRSDTRWRQNDARTVAVLEKMRGVQEPLIQRAERELQQFREHAGGLGLKEMQAFFAGYAKGLERGGFDENGDIRGGSQHVMLHVLMLLMWRRVESMRRESGGGTKLLKWIGERMGAGFAMSPKSFTMFCRRLGLKLGPVGRPRKIPTRSA